MTLHEKMHSRTARIGVIGLGYVGLPLVIEFCRAGFHVTGFDIDEMKIASLGQWESYIRHIDLSSVRQEIEGRFDATADFSKLAAMDCIIICVPTPLNKNREPDMRFVFDTARTIAKYLRREQLVVLESTTYPGTTDQDVREILEAGGLTAGRDFHLAFSPEREDPNNKDFGLGSIPKVVGGLTPACLDAATAMYSAIVQKTVPVSSPRVAEAAKLLENIYRSVNIALVNELKMLFDRMGIDVWEVIEAARTKPFGFQAFHPGPGLGGHCIPIDPFYLTWKAREFDFHTRFIELAGEINTAMPDYVVLKVMKALNAVGKHLQGSRVLILGLAYKENVDDDRESPSYRLMEKLEELGAEVSFNDPCIPVIRPSREYAKFAGRRSQPIDGTHDLILIATAHAEYRDIDFAALNVPIVDTRNVLREKSHLFFKA
ncbi:MAG TPA: nucleotide sugar dehydrogenase [Syntrophales bacterium]|nr:nucleotide sugar dehydrogenase [Syntrophales bacterium]